MLTMTTLWCLNCWLQNFASCLKANYSTDWHFYLIEALRSTYTTRFCASSVLSAWYCSQSDKPTDAGETLISSEEGNVVWSQIWGPKAFCQPSEERCWPVEGERPAKSFGLDQRVGTIMGKTSCAIRWEFGHRTLTRINRSVMYLTHVKSYFNILHKSWIE